MVDVARVIAVKISESLPGHVDLKSVSAPDRN